MSSNTPAWLVAAAVALSVQPADAVPDASAARCAALPDQMQGAWPDPSTRVVSTGWVAAGPQSVTVSGEATSITVPAHCELIAAVQERIGEGGQHYAIRFHLRLPGDWNGRFLFQGGGGSNGVLGDALGNYSAVAQPALAQGYAVVSQDSGHDNAANDDPARGGVLVFGFDPQARANYGYDSLPIVARAAKAAIRRFYGSGPRRSYFVGCSKGGEEGMALSQRDPGEFDGIVANSPGMSLPRAAVSQAWDTQSLASLVRGPSDPVPPFARLALAFSDADLALVRDSVLAACDADDGVTDGVVGDFTRCTTARVAPELGRRRCDADKTRGCLGAAQIEALERMMRGPHDAAGKALYSDWPWDAGIGLPNWRSWKMGIADGSRPALNVVLGGASLASDFTTPPTPLGADPQSLFEFVMGFDFDRDAPKIYATNRQFAHSAWYDIAARSADLGRFRAHGAKMIVVHGVSDPVFSINDTLAWWNEVDRANQGHAAGFVRVFPVPGMNHCGGGDATDRYDVLTPLTRWVEQREAPDSIPASSRPGAGHAGRTRPLCPYPKVARYKGDGDPESARSFGCK